MTFASWEFFVWLMAAAVSYHLLPMRCRPALLLLISVAFYASWSVPHTLLLAAVTACTWIFATRIEASQSEYRRRVWLVLALALPLILLFFFKALQPLDRALNALAGKEVLRLADLVVPLGISFYSFKILGYLLDVYWERTSAERNLLLLASHVFFFPQILCGPIQRTDDFTEQLRRQQPVAGDLVLNGMVLIALGFLKKLAADQLTYPVQVAFDNPQTFPGLPTLLAAYLFTLQLYLDFSGYSEIAVGLGNIFGIECQANFAGPLLAGNVQEFWKRWHITLTSWMRDYVFTPCYLSMRHWGRLALPAALLVNMVMIGLWHDFKWTFLVFGLVHAGYMIVYALTPKVRALLADRVPAWPLCCWLLTFHAVVLAFIVFRAPSLSAAWQLLRNIRSAPIYPLPVPWTTCVLCGVLALLCQTQERGRLRLPRSEGLRYGFLAAAMVLFFFLSSVVNVSFLYQKF